MYDDIALVGEAIDAQGTADGAGDEPARRARRRSSTAVAGAERPRTFYEVGVFEGSIYTAGKDSFLASLISLAGGEPIIGDAASTAIQLEDLISADPELILLGDATLRPHHHGRERRRPVGLGRHDRGPGRPHRGRRSTTW